VCVCVCVCVRACVVRVVSFADANAGRERSLTANCPLYWWRWQRRLRRWRQQWASWTSTCSPHFLSRNLALEAREDEVSRRQLLGHVGVLLGYNHAAIRCHCCCSRLERFVQTFGDMYDMLIIRVPGLSATIYVTTGWPKKLARLFCTP